MNLFVKLNKMAKLSPPDIGLYFKSLAIEVAPFVAFAYTCGFVTGSYLYTMSEQVSDLFLQLQGLNHD